MSYGVISSTITFLYPFYASYKSTTSTSPAQSDAKKWSAYWCTLALILFFEHLPPITLVVSFLGGAYTALRTLFIIYLLLPDTRGAEWIFYSIIHPVLGKYEGKIEESFKLARTKVWDERVKVWAEKGCNNATGWLDLPPETYAAAGAANKDASEKNPASTQEDAPSPLLLLQSFHTRYTPIVLSIAKHLLTRQAQTISTSVTATVSSVAKQLTPRKSKSPKTPTRSPKPIPHELDLSGSLASSPGSGISTIASSSPSPSEIRARALAKKRDESYREGSYGPISEEHEGNVSGREENSMTGSRYERIEREDVEEERTVDSAVGYDRRGGARRRASGAGDRDED